NHDERQLGPDPKGLTQGPVRIGTDSDWSAIFSSDSTCIGVKRDGSVWKWDYFGYWPNGWEGNSDHAEPVRWNVGGSDLVQVAGDSRSQVVVRRDGTLWATGYLVDHLFGTGYDRESTELTRVGRDSDWAGIAGDSRSWGGLVA